MGYGKRAGLVDVACSAWQDVFYAALAIACVAYPSLVLENGHARSVNALCTEGLVVRQADHIERSSQQTYLNQQPPAVLPGLVRPGPRHRCAAWCLQHRAELADGRTVYTQSEACYVGATAACRLAQAASAQMLSAWPSSALPWQMRPLRASWVSRSSQEARTQYQPSVSSSCSGRNFKRNVETNRWVPQTNMGTRT